MAVATIVATYVLLLAVLFVAMTVGSAVAGWGPEAAADRLRAAAGYALLSLAAGLWSNACDSFCAKRGIGRYRRRPSPEASTRSSSEPDQV